MIDIYNGSPPEKIPIYGVSQAAHYLHVPAATIRSWVIGRGYPIRSGKARFAPLIPAADDKRRLLSFQNLVEIHVLSAIRRKHKVKLPAVRKAINFLKERFDTDHPLLDKAMLTDGKDLFIDQFEGFVNLSRDGQLEIKQVIDVYLSRIDRNEFDLPVRLFPFSNDRIDRPVKLVSIDPRVRFGLPCIALTGIPTAIVAERYKAGDSVALLAEDYGRKNEEIEEAVRYEYESRIAS